MMSIRRVHGSFFGIVIMGLMLAACDQQGPRPGPIGPILPTGTVSVVAQMSERQTPMATPISPVASQVIEGIKVSVQPVAFDAHRVIVAYSLEGPGQPYLYSLYICGFVCDGSSEPILSLAGKELQWIQDADNAVSLGAVPPRVGESVRVQGMMAFDASSVEGGSMVESLPVQLSLHVRFDNRVFIMPEPMPTGIVLHTATPIQASPPARTLPFAFSFTMPFDTGRVVVQVNQKVESNDVKMTLERVDVTASEARVILHYEATKTNTFLEQLDWVTYTTLHVGTRSDGNGKELIGGPDSPCRAASTNGSEGDCVFSFVEPEILKKDATEYGLTITADRGGTPSPLGKYPGPLGRWTFHFTVPPVEER